MSKTTLIAIAGGTGSGKSSLAESLFNYFEPTKSVKILREDDYYKDQSHLTYEERCKTNYDHPFAYDTDLLKQHLTQLLDGKAIEKPIYDFTVHNRSDKTEIVEPCDVIIYEGLFALHHESIRELEDIKIFIETDDDIRFIRRLKRDIVERERTMESVIDQYLTTVKPMHDQFIEPSKRYADVIIPERNRNDVALDLLRTKIDSIIKEKML